MSIVKSVSRPQICPGLDTLFKDLQEILFIKKSVYGVRRDSYAAPLWGKATYN